MKALVICDECNPAEATAICRAGGYGIEVQSFYDPGYIEKNKDAIETHLRAIAGIDLRSLHGPFADLCPGSIDAMVRAVARDRFELAVSIAARLDIEHVVLHHGYVPHTSMPSRWLTRYASFINDFLEDKPSSLQLHLENVLEWNPDLISGVIAAIDDPRVDVCLDIGHAHCNSKTDVTVWIERLAGQIGYVHLHDNHGEEDEHLGLGCGTIPMVDVCHALLEYSPDAIWALEVDPASMHQSLDWLKSNGFL